MVTQNQYRGALKLICFIYSGAGIDNEMKRVLYLNFTLKRKLCVVSLFGFFNRRAFFS